MTAAVRISDLRLVPDPVAAPAMNDDERSAAIQRWTGLSTVELLTMVARRGEAQQMLDEADTAAAVLEVRSVLETAEQTAAQAAEMVDRARPLVRAAAELLAGPDAEIAECMRRIADLEDALAAAAGADMATLKNLRVEIAGYRETLADLQTRRVGPADQLAAAQRALRDAQTAAASAAAAADEVRAKLADPLHTTAGAARYGYIARTAIRHVSLAYTDATSVHPRDHGDSLALLEMLFRSCGLAELAKRRGRDAALAELRRAPQHVPPRKS